MSKQLTTPALYNLLRTTHLNNTMTRVETCYYRPLRQPSVLIPVFHTKTNISRDTTVSLHYTKWQYCYESRQGLDRCGSTPCSVLLDCTSITTDDILYLVRDYYRISIFIERCIVLCYPDVDDYQDKDIDFNNLTMLLGTRVDNEELMKQCSNESPNSATKF